ncbi:hypothetical protein ADEAN_000443500 [Angomonas deanei]|uniref:Uncharacterized protein n=1 Tax=Angomonas deanei TaxID=59799 RepID=A0A7G2CDD4_9TRYP|nr:hypothetical protein ADEAN_000443500 [Angomonas deanei]
MSSRVSDSFSIDKSFSKKKAGRSRVSAKSELPLTFTPLQELSRSDLSHLRTAFPAAHEALLQYDRLLQNAEDRYRAKEAELHRCINVGQELLEQMDQLKEQHRAVVEERDALLTRDPHGGESDRQGHKERKLFSKRQREWEAKEEALYSQMSQLRSALRESDDRLKEEEQLHASSRRKLEASIRQLKDENEECQAELLRCMQELRNEKSKIKGLNESLMEVQSSARSDQRALIVPNEYATPASVDLVATTRLTVTVINQLLQLKEDMESRGDSFANFEPQTTTRLRAPNAQGEESQSYYLEWLIEALQKESTLVSDVFSEWSDRKLDIRKVQQSYTLLQQQKQEADGLLAKEREKRNEVEKVLNITKSEVDRLSDELRASRDRDSRQLSREVESLRHKIEELEGVRRSMDQRHADTLKEAQREREIIVNEARIEIEKLQRTISRLEEELDILRQKNGPAQDATQAAEVERCRRQMEELEAISKRDRQQLKALGEELEDKRRDAMAREQAAAEAARSDTEGLNAAVKRLREENANLRTALQDAHKEHESKLDHVHRSKTQLLQENQALTEKITSIDADVIPELKRENKETVRRLEEVQEELKTARQQVTRKSDEIKELNDTIRSMKADRLEHVDASAELEKQKSTVKQLEKDLTNTKRLLEQKETELHEAQECLVNTSNTVKSLTQQNKSLKDQVARHTSDKSSTEESMEKRIATLTEENEQLVSDRAEFNETIRSLEGKLVDLNAQYQSAKEDLDEAETRRRRVERLLVEAPASTTAWDTLTVALKDGVTQLEELLAAERDEDCQLCAVVLGELLNNVAAVVEVESERQSRAWETVRKRVLNDYNIPDSQRSSQGGEAEAPAEEAPLCVNDSLEKVFSIVKQLKMAERKARNDLEEKTRNSENHQDAQRCIQRLETDLKTAKEALSTSKLTIQSLEDECARGKRRVEELQKELETVDGTYRDHVKSVQSLEEKLAAKTREREVEKMRYIAKAEEAQRTENALQDKIDALTRTVHDLEEEKRELQLRLEESAREGHTLRAALETLRAETVQLQHLLAKEESNGSQLLQKQLGDMDVLKRELEGRLQEKQQEIRQHVAELDRYHKMVEEQKSEMRFVEQKLKTFQLEYVSLEKSHNADRKELEALRRVNHSLESRLAEVERDRDPLRQQLHSVLLPARRE